ncbi:IS3 family transposase [Ferrovum myxofaciens]|uniref:IS3 family transposase n=1 Tax=Ferrovum myxofaciens TaxID=416213 RepID=UPI003EC08399
MEKYSEERKAAVLRKMLPPMNCSIKELAKQEGISDVTLYAWRRAAKMEGIPVPGVVRTGEDWSAEAKLATVIETANLSEIELSEYCRGKGLYVEQVKEWYQAALDGQERALVSRKAELSRTRSDNKQIKSLERELARKRKPWRRRRRCWFCQKSRGDLGKQRGRLISSPDRQSMVLLIEEAVESGARCEEACKVAGIDIRTLQRWRHRPEDGRPEAVHPMPLHSLTDKEKEEILEVVNQPEYKSLPPSQIVPRLADKGVYLASESSFYRVMSEAGQNNHRGRAQKSRKVPLPTTHTATGPNQVWNWDITYLPSRTKGLYYYLYMFEDVYSRNAVAYEVHDEESGEHAARLVQRAVMSQGCWGGSLVLHSDNGSPMKSSTLLAKLHNLGITPSRSRPRVSNDNLYAESLFRTLKYCPQWPSKGFESLDEARGWVRHFVSWYNEEHCHSKIRFVTPGQRHRGEDQEILAKRHALYQTAKEKTPRRWTGQTRNWAPIGEVQLNPDRKNQKAA